MHRREFLAATGRPPHCSPSPPSPSVFNLVEGYNEAPRYSRLADDLSARGWKADRIEKLLGGNFIRLFGEVWGG